jgi:hypothetical protein
MTDSEIDKNKRKRSERRKKGQCQLGHSLEQQTNVFSKKNTKKLEINVNKRKRSEQEETKRKRSACGEQTTCSPKKIKFRKKQKENESFASDWRLR